MNYATVEDVLASFPHPVIPTVQGEPDYKTIHATRKFLQANSRAINTHLGLGPHYLGCFLRHDFPNNGRWPNTLDNITAPRVGTSQYGWNIGSNQRRLPHVGGGWSDLPDMHLHATDIEEANHQCVPTNVFGHLE
jgi:hypothetical protein